MKTRQGFVSNSSSCSFLIVGLAYEWNENEWFKKILEAEKINMEEQWCEHGQLRHESRAGLSFYGDSEVYWLGIDAAEKLEILNASQLKQEFILKVNKHLNIDVPLEKIKLLYGDARSG